MTDADRIAAKGVPITLEDGTVVRLRFGFREKKMLEDRFGGVVKPFRQLGELLDAKEEIPFGLIAELCSIGLHRTGMTLDDFLDKGDGDLIAEYVLALLEAFNESWPGLKEKMAEALADEDDDAGNAPAPAPTINGSTGAPSTTAPPFVTVAQTVSSGA